jgi:hypothetical protein
LGEIPQKYYLELWKWLTSPKQRGEERGGKGSERERQIERERD